MREQKIILGASDHIDNGIAKSEHVKLRVGHF
jgi:hypothetical protein